MTERGVIAVDRGVFTHPRFANEAFTEREAWIWLISEAAFKPHVRRVGPLMLNLRRGQVAHSLRFMAESWQWSVGKVRRFVKMLATSYGDDDALITAVVDTGVTVISICKYNSYQLWLRRADTPHVTVTNTPIDTPIDTANSTPQKSLNLYPTTPISDDDFETDTPVDTPADTRTDTGAAHLQHKRESIDKSLSSSSGGGGRRAGGFVNSVTSEDIAFAEEFLTIIKDPSPEHSKVGFALTVLTWRTRGYDLDWALAIASEIVAKGVKRHLRYFTSAVARQQDARARELAREANGTITPPPQPRNGHAYPRETKGGSVLASFDRMQEQLRARRSGAPGGASENGVQRLPPGPVR